MYSNIFKFRGCGSYSGRWNQNIAVICVFKQPTAQLVYWTMNKN